MRRVMTLCAVNTWLLLAGAAIALGGQASSTTQLGTVAAAA